MTTKSALIKAQLCDIVNAYGNNGNTVMMRDTRIPTTLRENCNSKVSAQLRDAWQRLSETPQQCLRRDDGAADTASALSRIFRGDAARLEADAALIMGNRTQTGS